MKSKTKTNRWEFWLVPRTVRSGCYWSTCSSPLHQKPKIDCWSGTVTETMLPKSFKPGTTQSYVSLHLIMPTKRNFNSEVNAFVLGLYKKRAKTISNWFKICLPSIRSEYVSFTPHKSIVLFSRADLAEYYSSLSSRRYLRGGKKTSEDAKRPPGNRR